MGLGWGKKRKRPSTASNGPDRQRNRVYLQFISQTEKSPFEKALLAKRITHKLIPPRTPWHNGKVERSHCNDQCYFYDWEKFANVHELNQKLKTHLSWSSNKAMRTLGWKSPLQLLAAALGSHH